MPTLDALVQTIKQQCVDAYYAPDEHGTITPNRMITPFAVSPEESGDFFYFCAPFYGHLSRWNFLLPGPLWQIVKDSHDFKQNNRGKLFIFHYPLNLSRVEKMVHHLADLERRWRTTNPASVREQPLDIEKYCTLFRERFTHGSCLYVFPQNTFIPLLIGPQPVLKEVMQHLKEDPDLTIPLFAAVSYGQVWNKKYLEKNVHSIHFYDLLQRPKHKIYHL